MSWLVFIVIVMGLVSGLGFLNEKVFHLTHEIALMLFSVILGGILLFISTTALGQPALTILTNIHILDIEDFLLHGVLCFMLFAGCCHMKLKDFREQKRQVTVLSILATLLGALFYGFLFYGFARLVGLDFTLPMCLMFGSIVAPTDPIAATSILKKFGLPKKLGFLIEGESLLNDGVGVALFVCFSGMVTAEKSGSFFVVFGRELFGAAAVGLGVMLLTFLLFRFTKDKKLQIFISIFAVSCAYLICEYLDFSGAIASVVCGVLYSSFISRAEKKGKKWELDEYVVFWDVLDNLLNSVLYVILGLSFIRILQMPHVIILSAVAIVFNLLARAGSLAVSTTILGPIPDGFSKGAFITILTWGGLRGGLCIALAMSTQGMISSQAYCIVLGCTYAIAFFTTVVQGLTMRRVYGWITKKTGWKPAKQ